MTFIVILLVRYGDVYAALKDCYTALSFDPSNHKAHLRQANCLHQLKWHKLARECILQFQQRFPTRAAKSQELAKAIEEDVSKSSKSKGEIVDTELLLTFTEINDKERLCLPSGPTCKDQELHMQLITLSNNRNWRW